MTLHGRRRLLVVATLLLVVACSVPVLHLQLYRPGYGFYYGIAKLLNEPLDLSVSRFETDTFRRSRGATLICPQNICTNAERIDRPAQVYHMSVHDLQERLDRIIMSEPGAGAAYLAPGDEVRNRYIIHSPMYGLPETIDVQFYPLDGDHATFALYARDLIRELAPDRTQRTERWLAALGSAH